MNTEDRLAEVDALWERVYERIASTLADIDIADDDDKEITYLRECVHDVVRDALVTLNSVGPYSGKLDIHVGHECGRDSERCWHPHRNWTDEGWWCPDCGAYGDTGQNPPHFRTTVEDSIQSGESAEVCTHGPSAYDTASGTPVRARIGERCDEAAKITGNAINAEESHWHYAAGHSVKYGQEWYDVREVYSNGAYTADAVAPVGESVGELDMVLRMMLHDVNNRPVVEVGDEVD